MEQPGLSEFLSESGGLEGCWRIFGQCKKYGLRHVSRAVSDGKSGNA